MLHSRRHVLKLGGGIFGTLALGQRSFAIELRQNAARFSRNDLEVLAQTFEYGVASGDPLIDRVILWTRVSSSAADAVPVRWQVALDRDFAEVVAEGETVASSDNDFTVKVDAILPLPGTTYYYRFSARDCWSMTGRTRTAPATMQNIRLAVVSCSSIWSGYFNTYEHLAQRSDIDAILHVGDYVYDYADEDERRNMPADPNNAVSPNSLEAMRQRYRYYRKDPFLRHAHQQHPWIHIWDNHDIDGDAGRAACIQAFHEWVPIRAPQPDAHDHIYRRLAFGPMLDLILLDTRHIGRDSISVETDSRSILGDSQFHWLQEQLQTSEAHWRILGNQVLMASCKVFGRPISTSHWDGYAADRDRVLRVLRENGIQNTLVATGDAHLSFASNLEIDGQSVGVELLPSSVTRGNLDEQVKGVLAKVAAGGFAAAIKLFNPHIRYFESTRHGYGLIDLRQEGATLEFWYLPHVEQTQDHEMARAVFVPSGEQRIALEKTISSQGIKRGLPAPDEPRFFQSSGEVGGTGGEYFNDEECLRINSRLRALRLRSGDRIDALSVHYTDGLSYERGGTGGKEQILELQSDEYIRRLTLGVGKNKGNTTIHYLKLQTSRGRILEGGKNPGITLDFVADPGRHIIGFRGRSGKELDKLGPIFAPDA